MEPAIFTLENGVTVVSESVDHAETVSVGIRVGVGSRHERLEDHGISHFLEHMAFKGTQRRTSRQIAEEIESVGGYLNAATGSESTSYHVSILKEDLELAVDILADIVSEPKFCAQELERERGVIIQEIHATQDTPDDLVFDLFLESAYSEQPMGRSILGTVETVKSFTPERLHGYLKQHYSASDMILYASGAVSHETLCSLAQKYMGHFRSEQNRDPLESALYRGSARFCERDLEQVQLVMGFPGACYYDADFYAMRILSMVMGCGMSSRLFREVRELRGLCYCVSAFCWSYKDTGLLGIHAATGPDLLEELVNVVSRELFRATEDIRESELARVRRQFKAGLMMGLESMSARAERLARQVALFGRVIPHQEILDQVDSVTVPQIRNLAGEIFLARNPTVSAVGKASSLGSYEKFVGRFRNL